MKYLLKCGEVMTNGCFWIAIQSNQLKDTGVRFGPNTKIVHNWKDMINETVDGWKKGFYIPNLFRNFRNSEEICDLTESVKSESSMPGYDLTNVFDKRIEPMSIHSMKPRWIRIYNRAIKKYLGEALRKATHLIRSEENNADGSIVVLYNDGFYQLSSDQIFDFCKHYVNSEENVFRYPELTGQSMEKGALKPILEFIATPKSCLLTKDELFGGCETESMIFISQGDFNSSYRSSLTRCISNLCVIEIIGEMRYHSIEKALPMNDFLECLEESNLQIYQCKTCTINSKTSELGTATSDNFKECSDCYDCYTFAKTDFIQTLNEIKVDDFEAKALVNHLSLLQKWEQLMLIITTISGILLIKQCMCKVCI